MWKLLRNRSRLADGYGCEALGLIVTPQILQVSDDILKHKSACPGPERLDESGTRARHLFQQIPGWNGLIPEELHFANVHSRSGGDMQCYAQGIPFLLRCLHTDFRKRVLARAHISPDGQSRLVRSPGMKWRRRLQPQLLPLQQAANLFPLRSTHSIDRELGNKGAFANSIDHIDPSDPVILSLDFKGFEDPQRMKPAQVLTCLRFAVGRIRRGGNIVEDGRRRDTHVSQHQHLADSRLTCRLCKQWRGCPKEAAHEEKT